MLKRPGSFERRALQTEFTLLLLALLTFLVGSFSVLRVKSAEANRAKDAINLNTADSTRIAATLGTGRALGDKIVAARQKQKDKRFTDVDALARLKISPDLPRLLYAKEDHMIVRTWQEAVKIYLGWAIGIALFFLFAALLVRRLYPAADPFLLPITALLCTLGYLLLFALKDPLRDQLAFVNHAFGIVLSGGIALVIALAKPLYRLPLHRYGYVYAIVAIAATVVLGLLGSGPGGVKLSVAGTQPVEAIKILMVFFLAAYLAERGALLNDPLRRLGPLPLPRPRDAGPLLVLYALPLSLFAIVRDLGPVLLLFGTFLLLLYLATGRGIYVLLGLIALFAGGFVGYKLGFGVFETRVDMWLSPWKNTHKSGDHLALGYWGLASGGIGGSGLGLGAPHFIPRGGSDLVFATLGEETGLIGTTAVVLCLLVAFLRGLAIARRASTDFERLLAAGLAGLLALQAFVIVAGTLGILPLAGITFPFLSYGKSSLTASFFLIGVLLALSGRANASGNIPVSTRKNEFSTSATRVAVVFAILLGVLPLGKLIYLQAIAADTVAAHSVTVPDADSVSRPHINPRLLSLANQIPRGRILDRNGLVLAETRNKKRVYPYGEATGHLIGYVDPALGGPVGLEDKYSLELRGFKEWKELVPLWRRKDSANFVLPKGKDVTLSLDAELQKAALNSLKNHTAGLRDRRTGLPKRRGAVVVIDVTTGEILAAATLPTYDPGVLTPAKMKSLNANLNGDFPLINRPFSGYYPPGSTFKIVTASTLFASNRADYVRTCTHIEYNVVWGKGYGRRRIVDDEGERPHGLTNLTGAVSESCNIYFAHAALELGSDTLYDGATQFGFSKLPGKSQFEPALPDIGYGQGPIIATPLEMASVAQTVAHGGKRLKPQLLHGTTPETLSEPLTTSDASRLSEMMRRVTLSGTAAGRFNDLPFPVAGKTGTAQNDRYDKVAHSWFIGFAPADNPKVAFAVIVENGGYGSQVAVPVTQDILRNISR